MTPEEISKQLRKPEGENGLYIAESMNKLSSILIRLNYEEISKMPGDNILEIGFGSGFFMKELFAMGNEKIIGLDYSETMLEEARKINNEFIQKGRMELHLGPAHRMPFEDNSIDKVVTINTIYFWEEPEIILREIKRVLKHERHIAIGIRNEETIKHLDFTRHNFEFYSISKVEKLLVKNGFKIVSSKTIQDNEYDANCIIGKARMD